MVDRFYTLARVACGDKVMHIFGNAGPPEACLDLLEGLGVTNVTREGGVMEVFHGVQAKGLVIRKHNNTLAVQQTIKYRIIGKPGFDLKPRVKFISSNNVSGQIAQLKCVQLEGRVA